MSKLGPALKNPKVRTALIVAGVAGAFLLIAKLRSGKQTAADAAPQPTVTGIDPQTAASVYGDSGVSQMPASGTITNDLADSLVHGYDQLASQLGQLQTEVDQTNQTVSDLGATLDTGLQTIGTTIGNTSGTDVTLPPHHGTGGGLTGGGGNHSTGTTTASSGGNNITPTQAPGKQKYAPTGWTEGIAGFFQANGQWNYISKTGTIQRGVKKPGTGVRIFK